AEPVARAQLERHVSVALGLVLQHVEQLGLITRLVRLGRFPVPDAITEPEHVGKGRRLEAPEEPADCLLAQLEPVETQRAVHGEALAEVFRAYLYVFAPLGLYLLDEGRRRLADRLLRRVLGRALGLLRIARVGHARTGLE